MVALKESLDTLSTHQALIFGIPKELDSNLLAIPNYAGCKIDRKSTSRGCHLLGRSLVS